MKQFHLAEIVTKDRLVHLGIFYKPTKPSGRAILWVHGLTDNFYGDMGLMEELSTYCEKEGWGLASFNTRGHDIVTSITKLDPSVPKGKTSVTVGSAYENFSECVLDIDAGISFLAKQGFSDMIIAGISTGANKVCFYAGTKKDPRVAGVILASPVSDVAIKLHELEDKHKAILAKVKKLFKKNPDQLVEDIEYMPLTPKRFLSLYAKRGDEDTFPYYEKKPKSMILSTITKPMMVLSAGSDEWADRPVQEIVDFFKIYNRSKNFMSVIIPDAFHSYGGKEKEAAGAIVKWLKNV